MNLSVYDVPEFAKAISDGAISFEEACTALDSSKSVARALQITGLNGYCDEEQS